MERETLNLNPNSVNIFSGDTHSEQNGSSFRKDSLPSACKVEARRCEQSTLNRESRLNMISDFPNAEQSTRDVPEKVPPVHKNGEIPSKAFPNGVNGICLTSGNKSTINNSSKTFESVEGDAWLQELERLCLSRDENDRSDLICSNTTSSNNISHNEGNDCTSDITTSHSTSNSQTEVATKLPSQDANSTQSSSRSGAINSTNMQSTEIIDGKDGENLLEKIGVDIESYENENDLPGIMALITKDLSEPYSIYTYRYFIHNWPQICFKATLKADASVFVGAIVCKLDQHRTARRGYIAMLAVHSDYRRYKIASTLVRYAIHQMSNMGCDEVVLETEVTNKAAMRLYEKFGFIKDKRLHRYYLNGVDAFRLKLWLQANH